MISFLIETTKKIIFAMVVLIAGVLVRWEGRPISEHLLRWSRNSGLQTWVLEKTKSAESLVQDAREGSKIQSLVTGSSGPHRERIENPERNRLRNLLRQDDSEADR